MTALALTKNFVCAIGAVAASLTFMTAAAGPAHAASTGARVSVADVDLSKDAGDQRECRRRVASTIDDALMLAPKRA